MKNLLVIVIVMLLSVSAYGQLIDVTATGVGKDAASSEKAALISSVKQAVGAFMDTETVIQNEEVLYDRILTVSDGFVSEYKVVGSARLRPDGLFETTIHAKVKKGEVGEALSSAGLTSAAVDGSQLWAQSITKLQGAKDAYEALKEKLPELYPQLINVEMRNQDGSALKDGFARPATVENLTSETITCTWKSEISMDLEWWFKEAAPFLEAAYRRLSSDDQTTRISVKVDQYGNRQCISDYAGDDWRKQILIETSSDRMRIGRKVSCFAFTDETLDALNKISMGGQVFIEFSILGTDGDVLLRTGIPFPFEEYGFYGNGFGTYGEYKKGVAPRQVYFFYNRTFAPEFRVDGGSGVDAFPLDLEVEVTPDVLREAKQITARIRTS